MFTVTNEHLNGEELLTFDQIYELINAFKSAIETDQRTVCGEGYEGYATSSELTRFFSFAIDEVFNKSKFENSENKKKATEKYHYKYKF